MARRSEQGQRLHVSADKVHADRLERAAIVAGTENGRAVLASELHRRAMPALLACVESCTACRAGTCDGAVHVQAPSNKNIDGGLTSNNHSGSSLENSSSVIIQRDAETAVQTTAPRYVEPNDKNGAAAQVESFFLKPEPTPEPKAKRVPIKRAYPEGFVLTDEMRAYAIKNGTAADRIDGMFEHFSNHHRAKGSRFVDWTLAFYTWVRNDRQYGGKNQASAAQPSVIQGGKDKLPW